MSENAKQYYNYQGNPFDPAKDGKGYYYRTINGEWGSGIIGQSESKLDAMPVTPGGFTAPGTSADVLWPNSTPVQLPKPPERPGFELIENPFSENGWVYKKLPAPAPPTSTSGMVVISVSDLEKLIYKQVFAVFKDLKFIE